MPEDLVKELREYNVGFTSYNVLTRMFKVC